MQTEGRMPPFRSLKCMHYALVTGILSRALSSHSAWSGVRASFSASMALKSLHTLQQASKRQQRRDGE